MKDYKLPEFTQYMLKVLNDYETNVAYSEISHIIRMLKTLDYDGEWEGYDQANFLFKIWKNVQ